MWVQHVASNEWGKKEAIRKQNFLLPHPLAAANIRTASSFRMFEITDRNSNKKRTSTAEHILHFFVFQCDACVWHFEAEWDGDDERGWFSDIVSRRKRVWMCQAEVVRQPQMICNFIPCCADFFNLSEKVTNEVKQKFTSDCDKKRPMQLSVFLMLSTQW